MISDRQTKVQKHEAKAARSEERVRQADGPGFLWGAGWLPRRRTSGKLLKKRNLRN